MFGLCVRFTCKDEAAAAAYGRVAAETVEALKDGEPGTLACASHLVEGQRLQRAVYELCQSKAAFGAHEGGSAHSPLPGRAGQYLASTEVDWLTLRTGKGTDG